ncbi:MAG: POTRA domain-containing protein [Myxococcota bacterium]|nr:POTRA domain-containing protein [Myxococcota bacterium]
MLFSLLIALITPDNGRAAEGEAAEVSWERGDSPCRRAPRRRRLQLDRQSDGRWVLPQQLLQLGRERTLSAFRFECPLLRCERAQERALISRLLFHRQGVPFEPVTLLRGWKRILQSGLFSPSSYLLIEEDRPADFAIRLCGRPYAKISSIDFDYIGWESEWYPRLFSSELRKRLRLRRGGRLVGGEAALKTQESQLLELYERQGYVGTEINIRPTYKGTSNEEVALTIVIREGERPVQGAPLVRGNQEISDATLREALAPDLFYDLGGDFFSGTMGLGRYHRRRFREQLEALQARYRGEGWFTARIRLAGEIEEDGVIYPKIEVREGPRVWLKFSGGDSIPESVLRDALTFIESGSIDRAEVKASAEAIEQLYQASARYFTEVKTTRRVRENGDIEISFLIDEGPIVYINQLELRGIAPQRLEKIRQLISTKAVAKDGVLVTLDAASGILQDAKLIQDLQAIINEYKREGFPQVSLRCRDKREERRRRGDALLSVWSTDLVRHQCFEVKSDFATRARRRFIQVAIEINEGPQTTLRELRINSFKEIIDERLREELNALLVRLGFEDEEGKARPQIGLGQEKIEALRTFLRRTFQYRGHLRAELRARCLINGEVGSCSPSRLYRRNVDRLHFDAELGPMTRVDGLLLKGSLLTRPELIQQELMFQEGSPLGTETLFQSQSNLRSLGLFRAVNIETIGLGEAGEDDTQEPVTVVVTVEEELPMLFEGQLGFQLKDAPQLNPVAPYELLYTTSARFQHRNIFGFGWGVGSAASHQNSFADVDFGLSALPSVTGKPLDPGGDSALWQWSIVEVENPRLWGSRFRLSFHPAIFEQRLSDLRDVYRRRWRHGATLAYDFRRVQQNQGRTIDITGELIREERRTLSSSGERLPFEPSQSSFRLTLPRFVWDQRDNPLHPTKGWYLSGSYELLYDSETGSFSHRELITGQLVARMPGSQIIVVPTLRVGLIQTALLQSTLQSDFLFKAGGDGVSFPVRGYENATIEACQGVKRSQGLCEEVFSPEDEEQLSPLQVGGRFLLNGGLELRFPTYLLKDFWGALFFDFGAVATSWNAFDRQPDFFPSVGAGLRWLVTGQIPLRLDLAFPLEETTFAPQGQIIHFNIFYTL